MTPRTAWREPQVVRGVWPSFEVGPTPLHHPLPHNPGTPRWHAGARDGRAGVGGGGLVAGGW